jgi:DNA-directed RNA polymerase subunit F
MSGKLVEQHRSDEPAKELLARIRIEREKRLQTPKRSKTQPKAKMKKLSPEVVKEAISKLSKQRFSFDELSAVLQVDYDPLKDIVFELLGEPKPALRQVFDSKAKTMQLERMMS